MRSDSFIAAMQRSTSPPDPNEEAPPASGALQTTLSEQTARIIAPPQLLRNHPGWLCWRLEPNGDKKPRKVPYYVDGSRRQGQQGTPQDKRRLASYDAAVKAAKRLGMAGVGFAPQPEFNITALDFDNCVDEHGRVNRDVLDTIADTYAELSPSGKGVRAFGEGDLGNHKAHGEPFGFETFSTKGFVTFTGNVLDECRLLGNEDTVAPLSEAAKDLARRRFSRALVREGAPAHNDTTLGLSDTVLREALDVLPLDLDYDTWIKVGQAIHHETRGEGFDIWDDWSSRSDKYSDRDYGLERWNSFGRHGGAPVTGRTLVQMANQLGAGISTVPVTPLDMFEILNLDDDRPPSREPVALDWHTMPDDPPEPAFVIPGWMPDGVVTLFAAHGGTGKSYLSLYIALCLAIGRHPFDSDASIARVKVVLYSAEDNMAVMVSRLARYMRRMDITRSDVDGWLLVLDATECNNVLFTDQGKVDGRTTARFGWLGDQIRAFGASVLIFDNASDAMDANENDRAKVRQFMSALKRLASAVLLLAHVDAISSMADPELAKGYSGSTGWHNSARSRWFMARLKDTDDIVLTLPKVNYAKAGAEASIRWNDTEKLFEVRSVRDRTQRAADNRRVLLGLLRQVVEEQGQNVSAAKTTSASAYNTLKGLPGFPPRLKSADVWTEVGQWRAAGLVSVETYTAPNRKQSERIVLTDAGRAWLESDSEPAPTGADAEDFQ